MVDWSILEAAKMPPRLEPKVAGALRAAEGYLSLHEPVPEEVLTPDIRSALQSRLDVLIEFHRPATEADIALIFYAFMEMKGAVAPGSKEEADNLRQVRKFVLEKVPLTAIRAAALEFLRGSQGNGFTKPTSTKLRKRAEEIAAPFSAEHRLIKNVLDAQVAAKRERDPAAVGRVKAIRDKTMAQINLRSRVFIGNETPSGNSLGRGPQPSDHPRD